MFSKDLSAKEEGDTLIIRGLDGLGDEACDSGGFLPIEGFFDLLVGFTRRLWTGIVSVDTGFGIKKLYFDSGKLVFAGSNLMDDRLGEVIYREGLITLEALTQSAGQVTRDIKFGQVLVRSNLISNYGLWSALKIQIKTIVQSIFMVDSVYYASKEKSHPVTEIAFKEETIEIMTKSFAYGCMFRSFASRLKGNSRIIATPNAIYRESIPFRAGTFYGDLLELVQAGVTVDQLLEASKLSDPYTVGGLMELVHGGACSLEKTNDRLSGETAEKFFAPVRSLAATFDTILNDVRTEFGRDNKVFPLDDLQKLARLLREGESTALLISDQGKITLESLQLMHAQCRALRSYIAVYEFQIMSLIQFLLQVSGDHLREGVFHRIKQVFNDMTH